MIVEVCRDNAISQWLAGILPILEMATTFGVMTFLKFALTAFLSLTLSVLIGHAQSFNDFDVAPHNYYEAPLSDPMTALLEKAGRGEANLGEAPGKGRVAQVLKELDIPGRVAGLGIHAHEFAAEARTSRQSTRDLLQ